MHRQTRVAKTNKIMFYLDIDDPLRSYYEIWKYGIRHQWTQQQTYVPNRFTVAWYICVPSEAPFLSYL